MLEQSGSRHDSHLRGRPHEIFAGESVDRSDLTTKCRRRRIEVRLPYQIGDLIARPNDLKIRRSTGRHPGRVASIQADVVCDDDTLVRDVELTRQREPQHRLVHEVVDAFAQQIVRLMSAADHALQLELRAVRILRLRSELHAVDENPRWTQRVGKRTPKCVEL